MVCYVWRSSYASGERKCRRKIHNPYQYYHLNDDGENRLYLLALENSDFGAFLEMKVHVYELN